jgi:hypothetical protein
MAFDNQTRNLLQRLVGDCRDLLTREFDSKLQEIYGIYAGEGRVLTLEKLPHLDDERLRVATLLRERINHLAAASGGTAAAIGEAVRRVLREQAFTVLNRFAALRMAEERGIIVESVGGGLNSKGFKTFSEVAYSGLGGVYERYRTFLRCMFDEMAIDLGVLFDRQSPYGLLFPRENALLELFERLNAPEVKVLWKEDETIGWIYQYFNDPAERKKMREESSAPRNSRELAVRNQFFTPRYVVEFLTDNTLGRIWYEMSGGRTVLKEQCRYLVRRPTEVFLAVPPEVYWQLFRRDADPEDMKPHGWVAEAFSGQLKNLGEKPSDPDTRWVGGAVRPADFEKLAGEPCPAFEDHRLSRLSKAILEGSETEDTQNLVLVWATLSDFIRCDGSRGYSAPDWEKLWEHFRKLAQRPSAENLSQEELLKQPVFIPSSPIKDPRTILILDPACGSMHFGLYAFDLFEVIYAEAWDLEAKLGADSLSRPPGMKSLHDTYRDKDALMRDVPRLIIEHNIHGIDIDPRCTQIAGLSLWLRAQKTWQRLGLKPAERPAIKRSNIVCAEPMPGEKELLREFVEKEFPTRERGFFQQLLETISDKMQLAGQAGALLKIEEEISSAIEATRAAWQKLQARPSELFATRELNAVSKQAEMDTTSNLQMLTSDFFEHVEERIYAALRDYAEQAENGGGFQRRLFAEDAARGFAFIDVCRKRYDVALMNPPFGQFPEGIEQEMRGRWQSHANDIYVPFVLWASSRLRQDGRIGAITSRNFLVGRDQREFRPLVLGKGSAALEYFVDLGLRVLDGAEVDTATYILSGRTSSEVSVCSYWDFRREGREALHGLAALLSRDPPNPRRLSEFWGTPANLIAFGASSEELADLSSDNRLDPHVGRVTKGLSSSDDFRFLRLMWEPLASELGKRWVYCAKGADYSWVISNVNTVVDWHRDGELLAAYAAEVSDNIAQARRSSSYYFKPALTHTYRCDDFSLRALPAGCIFTNGSPVVSPTDKSILPDLLALFLSRRFEKLLSFVSKKGLYETGRVGLLPAPPRRYGAEKSDAWKSLTLFLMTHERCVEHSAYFVTPYSVDDTFFDEVRCLALLEEFALLSQEEISRAFIGRGARGFADRYGTGTNALREWVSYAVGVVFGRWDIRYARGEKIAPELSDPFAPLPVCPPGQLQNAHGLPARQEDVAAAYPVSIPWNGILVDDPNHSLDIERHVREVIEVIWKDRAGAIEHEACEILSVKTLRDYFRKPAGFFADHLKRYSKSRRQAPIYWPLATASGGYTLWIYYHRLTDQTLFQCVNDLVRPKITEVEGDLSRLTGNRADKPGARAETERLTVLRSELVEFRDELLRIAQLPYKPNPNDGVLITASPLWKLFRLPKWQLDLKACWESLSKGEYDWAHLAYSIWPNRVKDACKTARSTAIAHGLEELCEVKAPEKKAKRGKKKADTELDLNQD